MEQISKQTLSVRYQSQAFLFQTIKYIMFRSQLRQCSVQSKYSKRWQQRTLKVDVSKSVLEINRNGFSGVSKKIPFSQINIFKSQNQSIQLSTPYRKYILKKDKNSQKITKQIEALKLYKSISLFAENQINLPHAVNYYAPLVHDDQKSIVKLKNQLTESPTTIDQQNYQFRKQKSYIKHYDWRKIPEGGLELHNAQTKAKIKKILGFVIKKFLETGSVLSFSIPTFVMKPQSMLMTYCRSMGAAPILFRGLRDPLSRMKAFNAFILSFSLLFMDMVKPFNPFIGETFQAKLGPAQVFAEQISHHPPISALILKDKNYIIHGSLQLQANISMNTATGIFIGQLCIQFDDGYMIKGSIPMGRISGLIFGMDHFGPLGAAYSYDMKHQLVSSYELIQKDILRGYIGQLKPEYMNKFLTKINNQQRFHKYKHISQKHLINKIATIEAKWSEGISYNNELYFDYEDPQFLPYDLQMEDVHDKLQSDSSYRQDIILMSQQKIQQAQTAKQTIEERQRYFRKLRENYKKNHQIK